MNWKQKLSSRKLWAAIAGIIVGLVVAFGGDGETIQQVAGSVMSVVSAIIYILAEAGVDKASAGSPDIHILPDGTEDKHNAQNH